MSSEHEYVEMGRRLRCGCFIRNRTITVPGISMLNEDANNAVAMLNFWFDDRVKRHECGLVSEGNPTGVPYRLNSNEI